MTDNGNEDIERLLAVAAPRKAPAELRAGVLASVAAELDRHRNRQPTWQAWLGRAVAASVLFSAATFAGVSWHEARRMGKWDKRQVVRSDIAELTAAIASVTGQESAHGVEANLLSQLETATQPASAAMRRDIEEIRRWSDGELQAERSESNVKSEERT